MEELMFRGFLFPALARGPFGVVGAGLTTSAAWSALHAGYSVTGLLEVFAVGLYFAYVLVRTGSLRVPMFCHAAYNASALVLLLLVDIPAAAAG
jgi:membrane protease YdiL (CAAX protease family)